MFELVIPARNEESHVGNIVQWARAALGSSARIVVVDNASTDDTVLVAEAAGADEVVREGRVGKGFAVIAGLKKCVTSYAMLCDADVIGLDASYLRNLRELVVGSGSCLGRLALSRPPTDAPVTTLLARPLLRAFDLGSRAGVEPIGGLLLAERRFVLGQHLPGGWGFDIGCTLAAVSYGCSIPELPVVGVTHRHKELLDYVAMAEEVCLAILQATGKLQWDHTDCTLCAAETSQLVQGGPKLGDVAPASG